MHFFVTLFFAGLLTQCAVCQSVRNDTTFTSPATQYAVAQHLQVSSSLEHLYNGSEYISYDRRLTGHAFFPNDTMTEGRVAYEGEVYTVPMLYDIVKDLVVVVHTSGHRMGLHSDRVSSFSIRDHNFIRLDSARQATAAAMPSGFYELMYNGPTQVLARRMKEIIVNPTSSFFGLYNPKTRYYLRKDGQYLQVKNKRTLLTALADRRKQLTTFARQQKLSFRPSPEQAILKLTQYYDQLSKTL